MTILHHITTGRGALSLIKCDACGKQTEELTSRIHKSILHFCDLQCKALYYSKKETPFQSQYHKDRQLEHKDAKNKKKDEVKKRCMRCNIIYKGPPGNFPKNRDPDEPEPGLCEVCSQNIPYDEGETAGVVNHG